MVTIVLILCLMFMVGHVLADEYSFTVPVSGDSWELWPVTMPNHSLEQITYINYAWEISQDKEFLYMLKAENGEVSHDRRSNYFNNGSREPSYGFCQIHKGYHPEIVNDPRFFSDPLWQLEKCLELWENGTAFYAYYKYLSDEGYRRSIKSKFHFREEVL